MDRLHFDHILLHSTRCPSSPAVGTATMSSESTATAKYLTACFASMDRLPFFIMHFIVFLERLFPRKAFPAALAYKRPALRYAAMMDVLCVFPQRRGIGKCHSAKSAFFGSFPPMDPLVDFQVPFGAMAFTANGAHKRLPMCVSAVFIELFQSIKLPMASIQCTDITLLFFPFTARSTWWWLECAAAMECGDGVQRLFVPLFVVI